MLTACVLLDEKLALALLAILQGPLPCCMLLLS